MNQNQEPKTTIEQLMEECFALNQGFSSGPNYLHLTFKGDGRYVANIYGLSIIEDTTAIGVLTKLKAVLEPRVKQEAAAALARAEEDLAKAQARVAQLTAQNNAFAPNPLSDYPLTIPRRHI